MSGVSAVISFGLWGGPGGKAWNYIATSGITEITIYSEDIINSISFKDANGFISGQFGGDNGKEHLINSSGSVSIGPWGGTGGESFGFKVDPSYIKQITVSYGPCILSISFKDGDGHEYGPYGGLDPNDNGEKAVIEIDGNSERLTSISGTYGTYQRLMVITSLSFVINSNIKGPYGSQTGTAFSIPIQGSEAVGFFGSSGWYLDSVGLYVKPVFN